LIFIDTSWFYAAEVEEDINHQKAIESKRKLAKGEYGTPYTTNYVLDETITLLRFRASFEAALKFKEKIEKSKVLRVVFVDETIIKDANEIFRKYRNLKLSFTDCTSFAVMKRLGINSALSFDEDFKKAGFIIRNRL